MPTIYIIAGPNGAGKTTAALDKAIQKLSPKKKHVMATLLSRIKKEV